MQPGSRRSPLAGFPPISLSAGMPSLHPFFARQQLTPEPALCGTWQDRRRMHTWSFTLADDEGYRLHHVDEESRSSRFAAHLFRIEQAMFLDLTPLDPDARLNPIYALHTVPAHNVLRVSRVAPTLQLAFLSYTGVKSVLEKTPGVLAHARLEHGEFVLTASTFDLQRFILQDDTGRRAGIFENPLELIPAAGP